MKYTELISELNYWKEMIGEEDPEIVINTSPCSYKIDLIQPVKGIQNNKAIEIIFN